MVTLDATHLDGYDRFSLYNSPYAAHREGCAIDLYPSDGRSAPSPVAGEVVATRTVDAPPKPYAAEQDHLIAIDIGSDPRFETASVARVLHVDPAVSPGDRLQRGDSLGRLLRSGFFAPWVDNHVHLGFRPADADYRRASGWLPITVDVPTEPLAWDGTGRVVETGDTYAVLDAPAHPDPSAYFVGLDGGAGVLDGGLPHYDGGGLFARNVGGATTLLGQRVGTVDGRTVAWDDVTVLVDGHPITGLSLFLARDGAFGAKLVCPELSLSVGESVTVSVQSA